MNLITLGLLVLSVVQGQEISTRIVDGTVSSAKPWMVALRHPQAACGGTLYTKSMVISAAHCVLHNPTHWLAHVNQFDLTKLEEGGTTHKVERAIPHPQYSKQTLRYDVSVWWIDSSLDERTVVRLDDGNQLEDKINKLNIMGWGHTNRKGLRGGFGPDRASNVLMEAQVPLNDNQKCLRKYPTQFDPNTMICTGYDVSNSATCQGDSGGPVFRSNGTEDMILVGIVSFGVGCGYQDYYSVKVKVSNPNVSNFINQFVNKFTFRDKRTPTPPNDITTPPSPDGISSFPSYPIPSPTPNPNSPPHHPIIIRKPRETRPHPISPDTIRDIINAIHGNRNRDRSGHGHYPSQPDHTFGRRPHGRNPFPPRYPRHTLQPNFPSSQWHHRPQLITNGPLSPRHYHPQSRPFTQNQFTVPVISK